jgi:hypothetical protein
MQRDPNQNLRTQFLRIISCAALQPWPTLFQNLRASSETELAGQYPIFGSGILSGSPPMVVTNDYFEEASRGAAKCAAQKVQNRVQQPAAVSCTT